MEWQGQWPRGPMEKASAHGAGDCRFEFCQGQLHWKTSQEEVVPNPRGLKLLPGQARADRLLAVRSNQLSYEASVKCSHAEGRQFDPGQVYASCASAVVV